MKILGLDPGSHATGFCVLQDGKWLEGGTIESSAESLHDRILVIAMGVRRLWLEHVPDHTGLEAPYVGKYAGAVIPLAQVRGAIVYAIMHEGAGAIMTIDPMEAKRTVGSSHKRGDKAATARAVQALLGLAETPPPDVADAAAIALTVLQRLRTSPDTSVSPPAPKPQRAARQPAVSSPPRTRRRTRPPD